MTVVRPLIFLRQFLAGLVALGLVAGFALRIAGHAAWSGPVWTAVTLPVLAVLVVQIVTSLRRVAR